MNPPRPEVAGARRVGLCGLRWAGKPSGAGENRLSEYLSPVETCPGRKPGHSLMVDIMRLPHHPLHQFRRLRPAEFPPGR